MARKKSKTKKHGKSKTPSFVLTLRFRTELFMTHYLFKCFEFGRYLYNMCVEECYRRYNIMISDENYKKALTMDKEDPKRSELFLSLKNKYDFKEYSLHAFVASKKHELENNGYRCPIGITMMQVIATQCFRAFEKLMYGDAKTVYYKKFGTMDSLSGKKANENIIFSKIVPAKPKKKSKSDAATKPQGKHHRHRKTQKFEYAVKFGKISIPVITDKNDKFARDCIESRKVKYCRIVREIIKGKDVYYVQLILEGVPPVKLKKDGTPRLIPGTSRVGIDDGVSTMGIVSDKIVLLAELAEGIDFMETKEARLQRALTRSRYFNNPLNYNPDRTIIKDTVDFKKKWYRSKNYMKLLYEYKEINRKLHLTRKQRHCELANKIIAQGTDVFTEDVNYKALAKRSKETKVSEKTGRVKPKSRYGKSILHKAPAMCLDIIDKKLSYFGKELHYLDPKPLKASQYNHIDDEYRKKSLSQRWNTFIIDDFKRKVQRDLYSAYLLKCVNDTFDGFNKDMLEAGFVNFLKLHDIEISRLTNLMKTKNLPSSMGVRHIA